jgi:hypothetical protein
VTPLVHASARDGFVSASCGSRPIQAPLANSYARGTACERGLNVVTATKTPALGASDRAELSCALCQLNVGIRALPVTPEFDAIDRSRKIGLMEHAGDTRRSKCGNVIRVTAERDRLVFYTWDSCGTQGPVPGSLIVRSLHRSASEPETRPAKIR